MFLFLSREDFLSCWYVFAHNSSRYIYYLLVWTLKIRNIHVKSFSKICAFFSWDSWMYPYQRTAMGNPLYKPYIVGIYGLYTQLSLDLCESSIIFLSSRWLWQTQGMSLSFRGQNEPKNAKNTCAANVSFLGSVKWKVSLKWVCGSFNKNESYMIQGYVSSKRWNDDCKSFSRFDHS